MTDDSPPLDTRRLRLAIASIKANPHLFSTDKVARMLGVAVQDRLARAGARESNSPVSIINEGTRQPR